MPAKPPHGDQNFRLDYVLGAHVQAGYVGSTDLLTRFAQHSDFASDSCIRKRGVDPTTGVRHLEEIAFEVVSTQSHKRALVRAQDMAARGVRRVFAVFVKKREVGEWSPADDAFRILSGDATIADPALHTPIAVKAVLDAAAADDAVSGAMLAKGNRVLFAAIAASKRAGYIEGEQAGEIKQAKAAIFAVIESRKLAASSEICDRIQSCDDLAMLKRLLSRAATAESAADLEPLGNGA